MKRKNIGVFVCHCGQNIAGIVDVEKVAAEIGSSPGVTHAEHYIYMCSEPGQELIRKAIREKGLSGVVISCCSPSLHERTYRNLVESEGVNPYHCEIANIREQCSWPHASDKDTATRKALAITRATVERLHRNISLTPMVIPLTKRALVIGAGVAGMQSALDIADAGYPVVLVEKQANIGGHARQLSGTFLTGERVDSLLDPLITRVVSHPNITVHTSAEVEEVSGYVGSFKVRIRQKDKVVEEMVGVIIVATGYELFSREQLPEYALDPDVVDGLQFESILAACDGSQIRRPSDGKVPEQVVFIQCAGSRDPEHGVPYCSRVCCMYTAKQAMAYKKSVPDGQAYVFYMDIRSDAKGYEEYVKRVVDEEKVLYLRGRVSRVFRDGDKIKVWGTDTLTDKSIEVSADLVVLTTAMVPSPGVKELARKLNIITNEYGFITEAHLKLRPVETLTAGIYLAGTAQWPRDLPDTVSSASGAASKVLSLFSRKELLHEPVVATVDREVCSGCGQCVAICAYGAIDLEPKTGVARVNEALCEGCGACAVTCPAKAMRHKNWNPEQFFDIIDVMTAEYA